MRTTFVSKKTLARDFRRVGIDENDLARLASLVAANPALADDLSISVRSGDGEDVFSTSHPEFFFDPNLPGIVSEVSISAFRYDSPLSCKVELSHDRARVVVDGEDGVSAVGLFHELVRELEARELVGGWLVSRFDSMFFHLLTSLVSAAALYNLFEFAITLAIMADPSFQDSSKHTATVVIGWICVFGTSIAAPQLVYEVQNNARFPLLSSEGECEIPVWISEAV